MVLLDTSASMMDDDVVKIIRLRNEPEAARKLAPKWRRAIDMVEWMSAQLPANSQFQVYGFNVKAKAVLTDTQGKWLDSQRSARHQQCADRHAQHRARATAPAWSTPSSRCAPSIRSPTRSS